jgi:response regulator RpfG family c-di-GMP phosphodiesterase
MPTLLAVDDEEDILKSMASYLGGAIKGLQIIPATSGAQGLDVLRRRTVDLILSDYKMPGMNGLEFLAKVREIAPQVPRIMMTAFPDTDLAMRALDEGHIEQFMVKPVEPEKLASVVREFVARPARR